MSYFGIFVSVLLVPCFLAFSSPEIYGRIRNNVKQRRLSLNSRHASTTTTERNLINEISVRLPKDWLSCKGWEQEAADVLNEFGVVALRADDAESPSSGIIKEEICGAASKAVTTRLIEMHRRIESRGMDPKGLEEAYRFSEIVCRDEGGKRFDLPVPFLGGDEGRSDEIESNVGSGRIGTPLDMEQEEAVRQLHEEIGKVAKPVLNKLWSEHSYNVAAAGFLVNQPGSKPQNWHRDGPDEGYIDCFVPLIDLNEEIGPTSLQPGTHVGNCVDYNQGEAVAPLLSKGDILLFDYRTIHRGQSNKSTSTTRTLAYAVYKGKKGSASGDIHNFPAALTLEYD